MSQRKTPGEGPGSVIVVATARLELIPVRVSGVKVQTQEEFGLQVLLGLGAGDCGDKP